MRKDTREGASYLDPVPAYDRIAPEFGKLSERRRAYLEGIEQAVIAQMPPGRSSLLDVGAGDGTRAMRIAKASGVEKVVLLEPSSEMRKLWPVAVEGWAIGAEELGGKTGSFDAITCLWNVFGHIFPQQRRIDVMSHCRRLLSNDGRIFIDLNNRYNRQHYGLVTTAWRMLRDRIQPREQNGDVRVRWRREGRTFTTMGHVFTQREFLRMAEGAGLVIEKVITFDYDTGAIQQSRFAGNPLYVLRRAR